MVGQNFSLINFDHRLMVIEVKERLPALFLQLKLYHLVIDYFYQAKGLYSLNS